MRSPARTYGLQALTGDMGTAQSQHANRPIRSAQRRLDDVDTLFVCGDTRHGLGSLCQIAFERVMPERLFGLQATPDGAHPPRVEAATARGHVGVDAPLAGALELLGGWDRGSIRGLDAGSPLWQPGPRAADALQWTIEPDRFVEARA